MGGCRTCRYHLNNIDEPYQRCLIYFNQGQALQRIREGLAHECAEFSHDPYYETDDGKKGA